MNTQKKFSKARWLDLKETLVINIAGWIPFSIGRALRKTFYRAIFRKFGTSVRIEPDVEFQVAHRIQIGNRVVCDRNVRIRCFGKNSQIYLKDGVFLDRGVDIKAHISAEIEIGENTYIGPYTCLSGDHIKIGKYCLIASHSAIYANNHNFADPTRYIQEQGNNYKGIAIEDDCWLGSGVRVLDGVTIGKGSVIGAGAVVTKDIPPYSIAVGVPAKVIGHRDSIKHSSEEPNFLPMQESLKEAVSLGMVKPNLS
ncbi:MAG TPA: acyltransferase [Leptolyngbyaceae cyanobacterium]